MKYIKVHTCAGKESGCIAGNQYHDVDVTLQRTSSGAWTSEVVETWGSNQGRREEHGRTAIAARGTRLEEVVGESMRRAETAKIHSSYCTQALSRAEAEAGRKEEALLRRKRGGCSNNLSRFSTEELLAEIRLRSNPQIGEGSVSRKNESATSI